jgi:hypothetical protein
MEDTSPLEEMRPLRPNTFGAILDTLVVVLQIHLNVLQTNKVPIRGPISYPLVLVALNTILWSGGGVAAMPTLEGSQNDAKGARSL